MTAHKAKPSNSRRRQDGRAAAPGRRGRRNRRSKGLWLGGLAGVAVLGAVGFAAVGWISGGEGELPDEAGSTTQARPTSAPSRTTPSPTAPRSPSSTPSTSPTASSTSSISPADIPSTGPGTFATASGGSGKVGKGSALRYRVDVEDGIDLSPEDVAEEVESILADPRGWTTDGRSAFQRVSGGATDFVVRVATATTVDKICGESGLNTRGEVNCRVGDNVMVNLKRWHLATPVYAKDITAYRALIINHEVGHFLGHGHAGCPGKGKPAPAMMQQIKGMNGCVPNVWPYDEEGRLITGPSVP
ncbi:DUF3152 domain-containing protein [Streptomyces spongiae]|uniref:DUF3152 domain-containing protein n=1 Tax=Streptomyces spongiae TaxID=565072 RepID=A0A5N8XQC6_9ACTN|nr:DUF3152 domain-containing protein [Streptomyces spongiae]